MWALSWPSPYLKAPSSSKECWHCSFMCSMSLPLHFFFPFYLCVCSDLFLIIEESNVEMIESKQGSIFSRDISYRSNKVLRVGSMTSLVGTVHLQPFLYGRSWNDTFYSQMLNIFFCAKHGLMIFINWRGTYTTETIFHQTMQHI